jgi:L-alanine-DL-glutamate epimerase-like enolase superfamily enzyme
MRIREITCFPTWGGGRNYLFVVVDTDDGTYGVGEAGLTGRERAVMGAIDHMRPLLIDQDPFRTQHLWQLLSRGGFFPHDRVLGSALAAIDIALWDIKGKALGVPVYTLLGGRVRDKVPCYCHLGGGDQPAPDALLASAEQRLHEGWRYLRFALPTEGAVLEPTRAIRHAVAQFEALRDAFGEGPELCFDVHTRLDLAAAVRLCEELTPYRPCFIEDPLRAESTSSYRQLRSWTNVPLAAGEQFASKWEFAPLIEEDLIDYARVDLCIAGGITEALKIVGWCETHHIALAVHNPLGPVSTAACVHLNLATPVPVLQEQPRDPAELLPEVVDGLPAWNDGFLFANEAPGLGITFDREAAKARPMRMRELPHLQRDDGSLTNW